MDKHTTIVIALGLIVAAVGSGVYLSSAEREPAKQSKEQGEGAPPSPVKQTDVLYANDEKIINHPRPPLKLKDLHGQIRSIDEWDGKLIVVNFWATWCPPCRRELPAFNKLHKKLANRGVQFIGVAIDDQDAVEDFLKIIPINYPVLLGDEDAIRAAQRYGNFDGVLPYTVFIRQDGSVASIFRGALNEETTANKLEQLLEGKI